MVPTVHTVHRNKISPCLYDAVMLLMPSAQLIVAYCAGHTANTVRADWRVCKCYGTYLLTPRRYNPCRVLADSRSRLQPSLSPALVLQFLTPNLSAPLIIPSIHLRFGLPVRFLPSGLSMVIFLHGRLSCIPTICPANLSLAILIVVTKSISS